MDLAQLETSTPFEVLVHVKGHLLTQNAKSLSSEDGAACAYKGTHCRSCGAGCLLSKGDYNRLNEEVVKQGKALNLPCHGESDTIEGLSWCDLCSTGLVTKDHMSLITKLQSVHDTVEVCQWPLALSVVEADLLAGVYDVEKK